MSLDEGGIFAKAFHFARGVRTKIRKIFRGDVDSSPTQLVQRVLIVKPEILYMDEPFSALDALTSLRMRKELLRILAEERHTVVLITHDVEEAIHLADRIFVLSARPTAIRATFAVPFAQPRRLSGLEVQELRGHTPPTGCVVRPAPW